MAVFAENRKVRFDYEILESFEAGIALTGQEVKSVKLGHIQLAGAYISLRQGELFLVGAVISPYQPGNAPESYNPRRARKLLVHKQELMHLFGKTQERGLTMVPIRMYNRKAQIKLEFALVRGKKKYDKRETLKKREAEREMRRADIRG